MVVSAATVLSVLIYAGAVWTWRALVPDPTLRRVAQAEAPPA
jgi:hypothetical protein